VLSAGRVEADHLRGGRADVDPEHDLSRPHG
jgi:hypothetical protein